MSHRFVTIHDINITGGPHFQHVAVVLRMIRRTLRYLRENHPNAIIIYRDTPSGHTPQGDLPLTEPPPVNSNWNWDKLEKQNEVNL